ncbi:Transposon Ty3-I Gag-Pol polyprotein-like protein, partial [Leptotrombidium deliense]
FSPSQEKIEAVQNFRRPRNPTEVKQFLGLTGFHRRFIKNYSIITADLRELLKKNVVWHWTEKHEHAFNNLRNRLCEPPILTMYNPEYEFTLMQAMKVSALFYYKGNRQEILHLNMEHWTITEKELYAVVWAIKRFRPYLYGRKFTVVTDHHALCTIRSNYSDGNRGPYLEAKKGEELPLPVFSTTVEALFNNQQTDDFCNQLRIDLQKHIEYTDVNGVLYRRHGDSLRLVVPQNAVNVVLKEAHDDSHAGHLGFHASLSKLRRNFYWPHMRKTTSEYINSCDKCQKSKDPTHKPYGLFQYIDVNHRFERFAVDIAGSFHRTANGFKYIVVETEYNTKWVEIAPLRNIEAKSVAKFLYEKVFRFCAPKYLLSDQGSQFASSVVKNLCDEFGSKPSKWDIYLPSLQLAYNTKVHDVTRYTPYFLMFGAEYKSPLVNDVIPEESHWTSTLTSNTVDKSKYTSPSKYEKLKNLHILCAYRRTCVFT